MIQPTAGSSRRCFLKNSALAIATLSVGELTTGGAPGKSLAGETAGPAIADLPQGAAPTPVATPHFPDRLHAFIWRNWPLVPLEKMAAVVGAKKADLLRIGQEMGLPRPPRITRDQQSRSHITVIKRNWHLLPYEQLLDLLGWNPAQMEFALREDDFLYSKLGGLKPRCGPLKYAPPGPAAGQRAAEMARILHEEFDRVLNPEESLFDFIQRLSTPPDEPSSQPLTGPFSLRFCSSYFALYGDPLLDSDPYPEGYLARLARSGVNGIWLQAVLHKLAPFPWDSTPGARHEERLKNLRLLVARARRYGIGVYLYLNEPRSMPLKFFASHPELRGVVEGGQATLCTSHRDVQHYLTSSIASICRAVPHLAGFFTITGSENLTNCWSHAGGRSCPRCGQRPPSDVIAEVNRLFLEGIQSGWNSLSDGSTANSRLTKASPGKSEKAAPGPPIPELIVWDWGWNDAWAESIIQQLPREVSLMSVSEWSLPIERGGVRSAVGEYSISAIGPGPRARRHWNYARQRGLKTIAKIQAGNTWELSAVPYIPALENVARHAMNLRDAQVDGLMLGWTLGGYPSPNLDVIAEVAAATETPITPLSPLQRVALRRFGPDIAPAVVTAWQQFSAAFSEFPFHADLVYSAPLQVGPANPLWGEPTGYRSSMVGFPYDHLDGWRAIYPADVFIGQFEKIAGGFDGAIKKLKAAAANTRLNQARQSALQHELNVAEAAAIHFHSVANQAAFVLARNALGGSPTADNVREHLGALERILRDEIHLARRLHEIQSRDSRIGFESSNQYYYVPLDLVEKVLNCRDLLDRWLPGERAKWSL